MDPVVSWKAFSVAAMQLREQSRRAFGSYRKKGLGLQSSSCCRRSNLFAKRKNVATFKEKTTAKARHSVRCSCVWCGIRNVRNENGGKKEER